MNNDFCVDTSRQEKRDFLEKIKVPLNIALFFTCIQSVMAIAYFVIGIKDVIWNEIGIMGFVTKGVQYLAMVCIFVSLIKLLVDEKPFSHTLSVCVRIIAIIYLIGAVVFPRLPGYVTNFQLFSSAGVTLVDGNALTVGIVLYVLSMIVREGFAVQQEVEEEII